MKNTKEKRLSLPEGDSLSPAVPPPADSFPVPPERSGEIDAIKAQRTAIEYCLFHYPTLYTGGVPRRPPSPHDQRWIVPIVLSDPDAGIAAEVGQVTIDACTGQVVDSTDRSQVVAAGEQLYRGQRHGRATTSVPPGKK